VTKALISRYSNAGETKDQAMPAISGSSKGSSLLSTTTAVPATSSHDSRSSTTALPATPRRVSQFFTTVMNTTPRQDGQSPTTAFPATPQRFNRSSTTAPPATPTHNSQSSTAALPATPSSSSDHEGYNRENDSTLGSSRPASVISLSPSDTDYTFDYGRQYQDLERYPFPNDEQELDRLDDERGAMDAATGYKLIHAPIERANRLLDLGAGTGGWVIDAGDLLGEAEIFGADLSPIQPTRVPPNVHFHVMDIEEDWRYSEPFDLIRCARMLCGSVANRSKFFAQAYK
jgi:hypothetical protein